MEEDTILSELWGDGLESGTVEFDGPYGVGKWPDAVLMDVQPIERKDESFGYRVQLVFNLKGEDGMKYTARLDLPRTVERNGDDAMFERANRGSEASRATLGQVLVSAGLLPSGKIAPLVDTEEAYDRIVSVFRHGVGRTIPIEVKVQRRLNKDTGKWENTDFTQIKAIRPAKSK